MSEENKSDVPAPPMPSGEAFSAWEREHAARRADMGRLLQNIKARLPELSALLEKVSSLWHGEDGFALMPGI